ncbi:MAG: M50 family metallopeptidase [Candidatus Saccharimonadales bacterium]
MQVLIFAIGFLLFIGLILIHEWGHLAFARRNNVKVREFGLGFPPRAIAKKLKGGMILSLNWLPLGGFVKLKGEYDSDRRPGSFGAASLSAKTQILLAGVAANLVAGLILLTILALVGMPKILDDRTVGQDQFTVASDTKIIHQDVRAGLILPDSPAAKIGLKQRDTLLQIESQGQVKMLTKASDVSAATSAFAGQNAKISFSRNGKVLNEEVKLLSKDEVSESASSSNPKGHLGIVPTEVQIRRSSWSAPLTAVGVTYQLFELTLQGIGRALGGLGSIIAATLTGNDLARERAQTTAASQVGGPVAIGAILWGSGSLGLNFMLMIIAVLSLTLALINFLPIPALDGGRLAVTLGSRLALKRPLSQAAEERIHGTGMVILLGLIVLITIVDVRRFF